LDGRPCYPPQENETSRRGHFMPEGKLSTLVYVVRHDGVEVTCNGMAVISWHGDAARLSNHPEWSVPDRNRLYLGAFMAGLRIRMLEWALLSPETTRPTSASSAVAAAPTPKPNDKDPVMAPPKPALEKPKTTQKTTGNKPPVPAAADQDKARQV